MAILRPALTLFILLTLIVGGAYPLLTTGLAQWWFPHQANGSLVVDSGVVRGSALIGQHFSAPGYFHSRPSATGDKPYNGLASGGSNLAASNPALDRAIEQRATDLLQANPQASRVLPVDLLTASASGLDPHISPRAAEWQIPRVAQARGLTEAEVKRLVDANTDKPLLYFIGEPVVNVLALNIALDGLQHP